MSVDFILDYKPLDLAMVLLPVFVLLAIVEITAVYYLKIKTRHDSKEWFLNLPQGLRQSLSILCKYLYLLAV